MQITVADPRTQTMLFTAILLAALALTTRRAVRSEIFPASLTRSLKGFAILTVIFGHIGYALSTNTAFLQPLSYLSGVGVNLFLFLSGLGLTLSSEATPRKPLAFYRRRFGSLLVPLWLVLTVLYLADALFLHRIYPVTTIIGSYLGFSASAKMLTDLNAPLWYLTLLFAYYLAFPFLHRKGRPWRSTVSMLCFGAVFSYAMVPVVGSTGWLYVFHWNAFPLGMLAAYGLMRLPKRPLQELLPRVVRAVVALACAATLGYTAVHSGVGTWYEQPVSMVTVLATVALFALLPFRSTLLDAFGTYSYEMYLFHWPLLLRYDVLYAHLPPYAATTAYLAVFLGLGWLLERVAARIQARPSTSATAS